MMCTPLFFLFSIYVSQSTAVEFVDSKGDDLITDVGEGTNVVADDGVDQLILAHEAEGKSDEIPRVKRAVDYQVPSVYIYQNGESRIVLWKEASGPLPVTKYNIYRTFTTEVPFDVTRLDPIATIGSSEPRRWTDACRTDQVSVRYAVTAVDITGTEHTSNARISNLLPLVGSFVSKTPIKYPSHSIGGCCVLHHSIVFNPHLSEFLLAYDCDTNNDGNGDDVFMTILDYAGNVIQPAMSIKTTVPGTRTLVQEWPSVAYNTHLRQYLVVYQIRAVGINGGKLFIVTRVIETSPKLVIESPRLSLIGSLPNGGQADLRKSSVIYNPVTRGYVVSVELVLTNAVQIIFSHLASNGGASSSGVIFSFPSFKVLQTALIHDTQTETIVFVSQLDKSHSALGGKYGIVLKSIAVSASSAAGRKAHVIGLSTVEHSSINIHRETATGCLRVCHLIDRNNNGLTEVTCAKACSAGTDNWSVSSDNIAFCTCKEKATNPHIIEYPVSGSIFGVWEESDQTRRRIHGYYASTGYFIQNPAAAIQKHPLAVYRSSDGQICVAWQHHSSLDTCRAIAFRCFEISQDCNDPCCCSFGDHCDACGFHICDPNAHCNPEKQCRCRASLGFSGDGSTCNFDPCTPGYHSCPGDADCLVRGKTSVCVRGVNTRTLNSLFGSKSRGLCEDGAHDCHVNAICSIIMTSGNINYTCDCKPGYFGDGKYCLDQSECHSSASRVNGRCMCNKGFVGNGYFCCPTSLGDEDVTLGGSVTLQFEIKCLGLYIKFGLSIQWYHGSSNILEDNVHYTFRKGKTKLVIRGIKMKHLGQYKVRFSVGQYGPYEISGRIDIVQAGGSCTCGLSGRNDPRISSKGETTKPGEFPWQAMLCNRNGSVFCGGVMISKCCILTAAHCVIGADAARQFDTSNSKSLTVCLGRRSGDCRSGIYKNKKEKEEERIQCFQAHRILVHQEYNTNTYEHDIAMILPKTSNCLKCRAASVRPICLPKAKRDKAYMTPGSTAWVTGWGEIHEKHGITTALRKGETVLVGLNKCRNYYSRRKYTVSNDQICASDRAGPRQGDSGGPLMVINDDFDKRFILVGLVSWGLGWGVKDSYGVYADVLYHIDWIYQNYK